MSSAGAFPYLDSEPEYNASTEADELDATIPVDHHSLVHSSTSHHPTSSSARSPSYSSNSPSTLDEIRQFSSLVSSYSNSARSIAVNASQLSSYLDFYPSHFSRQFSTSHGQSKAPPSGSPSGQTLRPAWNSSPDLNWDTIVAGSRSIKLDQTNSQTRRKASEIKVSQRSGRLENPPLVTQEEQSRFSPSNSLSSPSYMISQRSIDQIRSKSHRSFLSHTFSHSLVQQTNNQTNENNLYYWKIQNEKRQKLLQKGIGIGLPLLKQGNEEEKSNNTSNQNKRQEYYSRVCPAVFESTQERLFSSTLIHPVGNYKKDFRTIHRQGRAERLKELELRGRDYDPLTGVKLNGKENK
jgi:hypothetical protein